MLPRLDPDSIESWLEIEQHLDRQREKLLPELKHFQSVVKALSESGSVLAEFFSSDEGKNQLKLSRLRQSRSVILLGLIAAQAARPDGWTLLSTAGQLVRQYASNEIETLMKSCGHKTLKALMLATQVFDILDEHTEGGGIRVLYRLKPEWQLQMPNDFINRTPIKLGAGYDCVGPHRRFR